MRPRRPRLPFLPIAPTTVAILGVAAAVAITILGVFHLKEHSDSDAALRARLLATTLAERLRATSLEDRGAVVERAAGRSGAELLLLRQDGRVEIDGTLEAPEPERRLQFLVAGSGGANTALGRTRFHVAPLGAPLEHLSLVAFVHAPETPPATTKLLVLVAALTTLLVGIAALFALGFTRDVNSDVTFVRERIVEMAREDASPAGKPVPVRSMDQVGLLTAGFNVLVERFTAAERAYRQDLAGALAYDRDRSAFLGALSHELRTPLNAILGFSDVLLSEVDGPLSDEARENLTVVRTSGDHLRSLINDILDLSALESGELTLEQQEVDICQIAGEVVREEQVNAAGKPLEVVLEGSEVMASVDPRRVRQIIGNLVSNAVKFTAEGEVSVAVERRGRFVAIVVTDTGPGIAPQEQAAIFEEYQQAGDATTRRAGTGLGLAITRRLVQMHGGFIELESEVGRGARFTIVLPTEPTDTEPGQKKPISRRGDALATHEAR